eukprot:TRINITY_DN5352_c0_g1_i1.p1 TRINITY_DN5352_c0_g1~~TRINITY_DN5352_c0_g1_i1.p1  ORF type:complete len:208 (+),score=6.50 TRINITY_DN5352_c0_g1_i1:307-930(+)
MARRTSAPALVACLLLAALSVAQSSPSDAAFRLELDALQRACENDLRYVLAAQLVAQIRATNVTLRLLYNTTMLLPTNTAAANLGITAANIANMTSFGQFASTWLLNIPSRRYTFAQLKAAKAGSTLPTLLPNQKLARYQVQLSRREKALKLYTGVAFGRPGSKAASWGKMVTGDLFKGKFVNAHGVAAWVQAPNVNVTDIVKGLLG